MNNIKNFVDGLSNKPILIYGLGRSGFSAIKALKKAGASIVVGDDDDKNLDKVKDIDVEIYDETSRDFSEYAFLLLAPAIPFTHPKPHEIVRKAQEAQIDIICDIELFYRIYPDFKTIAITGTNGKSTTSTLLHQTLIKCGVHSQFGGNIGTAIFDLDVTNDDSWIVVEISSFQIDLCPTFRPDIAIILNLTPDHIDRHGDINHYAQVKERIAEPAIKSKYNNAIICTDDFYTKKIYSKASEISAREVVEISTLDILNHGVYSQDSKLYDNLDEELVCVGDFSEIKSLKGIHNHQNAACAYAALRKVGLKSEDIWNAMKTFAGLNHRQYLVRTINGVSYVDDSKATNAASTAVALGCVNNVYWIVGGRQKKTGLEGLEEFFNHIKHAFLIGESTEDFAKWLGKYGLEYTRCYEMDKAVSFAHDMAQENRGQPGGAGVVLLSPACASFDQFKSFEERGDKFTELVKELSSPDFDGE